MSADIYQELGVRRAINAMGNVTLLGGTITSPGVQRAMEAANQYFVPMAELQEKSGQAIAKMLGMERAYVTSGCFAALVLGIAGIMTDNDPEKIARLPDTTGMKNEILLQKRSRYHYDRCITVPGAKMVEVGDADGTTAEQLAAAIGPNTAGILFFAMGDKIPGTLKLPEVVAIAHAHGIRVIVDAASEVYPVERMTNLAKSGADLFCIGSKYLGAFNSAGILCGKSDLVDAASRNSFVGYETYINRAIGRGYKLDRQEIIGTVVAVKEWLTMDHEERLQQQSERINTIQSAIADLPAVTSKVEWDPQRDPWMRLTLQLTETSGITPADLIRQLKEGDPSVWMRMDQGKLNLVVHTLQEGEAEIVGQRLREVLGGR